MSHLLFFVHSAKRITLGFFGGEGRSSFPPLAPPNERIVGRRVLLLDPISFVISITIDEDEGKGGDDANEGVIANFPRNGTSSLTSEGGDSLRNVGSYRGITIINQIPLVNGGDISVNDDVLR